MYSDAELDFAYKYPFSEEAKKIIKELGLKKVESAHLLVGKSRLEEALQKEKLEYKSTSYGKADNIIAYAYARMLASAMKNKTAISRYAAAEAKRAADALRVDKSGTEITRLAKELGVNVSHADGRVVMGFASYLNNMPREESFSLTNQRLYVGNVMLDRGQAIKVIEVAIKNAIEKSLPIKQEELPKLVIENAKGIKVPAAKVEIPRAKGGSINWIDKLLATPIHDCRHRTVNIILAPYLVNVKGMTPEKAAETISHYIALCKTINPDTNITDRYIKYQCEYAKKKGLKPLSLKRAKSELGGGIDFVSLLGEEA